jgi:hypothetical protein
MVSGSHQTLRITSNPQGATVTANPGKYRTTTPGELQLPRKEAPFKIRCEKDGYLPATATVTYDTNPVIYGNLIFGGIVGALIDVSSGASRRLTPDPVHINLTPDDAGLQAPASAPAESPPGEADH